MTWLTMEVQERGASTSTNGVEVVNLETTGQRIYWLRRTTAKMLQKDLAAALGVAQSYVSDMEADKREPSADVARKIADVLNTTTDYLLLRTEDPSPPKDAEPTFLSDEAAQAAHMIDEMYPDLRAQALRAVRGIHEHFVEHAWRDQAIRELLSLIEATKGGEYRHDLERRMGLRPGWKPGEPFPRNLGGNGA